MRGFSEEIQKSVISYMYIPKKERFIAVVDNIKEEIDGIMSILSLWPNVKAVSVIQSDGEYPEIPMEADAILLDENMEIISGTEVAYKLTSSGYRGIIASITSGNSPEFTKLHFDEKLLILRDSDSAKSFVFFMNSILKELDSN